MFSRTFCAQNPVTKNLHIPPRFLPMIFYPDANAVLLLAYICTAILIGSMHRTLVFEIVHDESVKVYLHMYNGNVQQDPLCVEPCMSKEFSISPRLSPTICDPDANSALARAHICTAVDSMRRKPCFRIIQESVKVCTSGMSSRTLYAQHSGSLRTFPSLLGSRLCFFITGQIQHPLQCTVFYTLQPKLVHHPAD